jgi:hypothetical protein
MFPEEARIKFSLYTGDSIFLGRLKEMSNHIDYRKVHPEEPPLVVLSAMPKVTTTPPPIPIRPPPPIFTPDAIQVERWKEYQMELAKRLFSYIPSEEILCEWDILKISDKDVYVWVVCKSIFESSSTPAVIRLKVDGAIQSVEIPGPGLYDYPKMFPSDVQEKFTYYRYGRAKELSNHIDWRRGHPEELPLIILNITPTP